jgi:hypothetical protein
MHFWRPTFSGSGSGYEYNIWIGNSYGLEHMSDGVSQMLRANLLREVQPRAGTERLLIAATLCA